LRGPQNFFPIRETAVGQRKERVYEKRGRKKERMREREGGGGDAGDVVDHKAVFIDVCMECNECVNMQKVINWLSQ